MLDNIENKYKEAYIIKKIKGLSTVIEWISSKEIDKPWIQKTLENYFNDLPLPEYFDNSVPKHTESKKSK